MFFRHLIFAFMVMTIPTFAQTPPIDTGVSQTLAKWRVGNYSDVRYKLNLTLEKMSPNLKGAIEVSVNLKTASDVVLDWRKIKGKEEFSKVSNVELNGAKVEAKEINEHLVINGGKQGANTIKLDFTSPIATSGAAITRYVDKEDGAEYVYSLFVPSDASTAFPVFDQPDLKARFTLGVTVLQSVSWKIVTNTPLKSIFSPYCLQPSVRPDITSNASGFIPDDKQPANNQNKATGAKIITPENQDIKYCAKYYLFEETKPISTYVFAFAAGDFEVFTERSTKNPLKTFGVILGSTPKTLAYNLTGSQIYVRKSQAEKFKQHAAEVFRLNREGVKFLEDWFDYKFPFPKYDLVLIPEFPFGGMEHAGATFLREDRVIFPTEPTKNDYITRANVIFHEAAHQWFGDTVTMKWFDDLWLKEGFAEFMAYKTLAKVMPEYNAWKIFYERNKQAAYLTDVTRGTTPIYQEIPNLSSAKSAYGNIVYRKAPSFLRQTEFFLGEKEFQTAVRQFLKKHEFANAEWTDLVKEFETASGQDLKDWANVWVKQRGLSKMNVISGVASSSVGQDGTFYSLEQSNGFDFNNYWRQKVKILVFASNDERTTLNFNFGGVNVGDAVNGIHRKTFLNVNPHKPIYSSVDIYKSPTNSPYFQPNAELDSLAGKEKPKFIFPNYQDYGYGIFLLDEKSRAYVLNNIQTEKDDFLRSMMWGSLWDSVRFYELAPEDYVKLVIKNINVETDESTIATLLNRVSTAMNYYLSEPPASAGGTGDNQQSSKLNVKPPAHAGGSDKAELTRQLENLLIEKMQNALMLGQRITFYRAFVSLASTENAWSILKDILSGKMKIKELDLKTKDKFDIVTKLITLNYADGLKLLAELEKTNTDDAAKRYAYAAKAGIPTAENKAKFWKDFTNNKEISESYIESAFNVWNTPRHADLTLPYLEKALAELPNLKKNRKIFFVNGWLSSFIGGQKSEEALKIVNKFLADNPNLDKDLRLKILENADNLERAVKIRKKFES